MTELADRFLEVMDNGTEKDCVTFFRGMADTQRQSLAKAAEKRLRDLTKFRSGVSEKDGDHRRARSRVVRLAALATCSLTAAKSLDWRLWPMDELAISVLKDRRPAWLQDYALSMLDGPRIHWEAVRHLMKHGLVTKPDHDNYVLGMTNLLTGVGGRMHHDADGKGPWGVLAHLEREPDLLEDVWRLFELEGDGEYSLAAHDKYSGAPESRWDGSLVELAKRGVLPRERLLDCSLAAMDRGFAQFRVVWFTSFHEMLKPTLDERQARAGDYLRLLASPVGPVVSYALEIIEQLDGRNAWESSSLIQSLRPVMLARAKTTAKAGLAILERVARRDPASIPEVVQVVVEALGHEASDVQAAALGILKAHASPEDPGLMDAVRQISSSLAASVRRELEKWQSLAPTTTSSKPATLSPAQKPKAQDSSWESQLQSFPPDWQRLVHLDAVLKACRQGRLDAPPLTFDGTEFPRLDPQQQLPAIHDMDSLIDLAAALVEDPNDADHVEQFYDGVSRLGTERPADFDRRTGPLLKRIRTRLQKNWLVPFIDQTPESDLLGVMLAWLTQDIGKVTVKTENRQRVACFEWRDLNTDSVLRKSERRGLVPSRAHSLAERLLSGTAVATLCAPTHRDGWIDPRTLLERVGTPGVLDAASDFEKALSLLRLAPDNRSLCLKALKPSRNEYLSALRYALGATVKQAGPTPWLWIAAARARSPLEDVPLLAETGDLGPDAAQVARPTAKITRHQYQKLKYSRLAIRVDPPLGRDTDPRLLTVVPWGLTSDPDDERDRDSLTRIGQLRLRTPLNLECLFAIGADVMGNNLDWYEAHWHYREYLRPLLNPDIPMKPMGLLVLALGLGAKEPGEAGLATDIAIAAIEDGRLSGPVLGHQLAELLPSGLITAARWARTLQTVSQSSAWHAEVIRCAIALSLRGKPEALPRDLHSLVELLKELVIADQVSIDEPTRAFLTQITGTGKIARAARELLAAHPVDNPDRLRALQALVVTSRFRRLERWKARLVGTGGDQ